MTKSELDLEVEIDFHLREMQKAFSMGFIPQARKHLDKMTAIIGQRSPDRIRDMEKARGHLCD